MNNKTSPEQIEATIRAYDQIISFMIEMDLTYGQVKSITNRLAAHMSAKGENYLNDAKIATVNEYPTIR